MGFAKKAAPKSAPKASAPKAAPPKPARIPARPDPARPTEGKAPTPAVPAEDAAPVPTPAIKAERAAGRDTLCQIEIVKDGHFFIARTETEAGQKEYKNTVFEDLLTEMVITLQEQLVDK